MNNLIALLCQLRNARLSDTQRGCQNPVIVSFVTSVNALQQVDLQKNPYRTVNCSAEKNVQHNVDAMSLITLNTTQSNPSLFFYFYSPDSNIRNNDGYKV